MEAESKAKKRKAGNVLLVEIIIIRLMYYHASIYLSIGLLCTGKRAAYFSRKTRETERKMRMGRRENVHQAKTPTAKRIVVPSISWCKQSSKEHSFLFSSTLRGLLFLVTRSSKPWCVSVISLNSIASLLLFFSERMYQYSRWSSW